MSDTTTTAGYLRRTGEWILIGGLPVIVESIAWSTCCRASMFRCPSHRSNKKKATRDIFLRAMGDEGTITPAERALNLVAQKNLLLGDSLVLWRAWELSSYNLAPKWMLVQPGYSKQRGSHTHYPGAVAPREHFFAGACGKKAVVNWCLSLLSNLLSTCIIAYMAWYIGEKILGLLAESGFFYFFVNIIFVITITSSPDTYSADNVVASVFTPLTACVGAFLPMATHVTVLVYGSLWDAMTEHNHLTTSIQFAAVGRIPSEASLESPESVLHGIPDVSKETSYANTQ
ncbi:hypothetical protein BDZ89DRAFT_1048640 [Hymenopellis radicata]|nr:hypothetical protein BDZ89DRAFT_1048640 [Hymenopellis radicata]